MDNETILGCRLLPLSVLFAATVVFPLQLTAGNVLIVRPGGPVIDAPTDERLIAESEGHTVTLLTDLGAWQSMSTQDFAAFDAIVFAECNCGPGPNRLNFAVENRDIWSPAIEGNIAVIGTAAIGTLAQGGPPGQQVQFIRNAINFAAGGDGTGLYMSLSTYYAFSSETPVEALGGLGDFRVIKAEEIPFSCADSAVVAEPDHPVMAGITDSGLSNWFCSMYEWFTAFPSSLVALATETGRPYIIATGQADVALLDPVPDLLSGSVVTTDPELLATGGTKVDGVAADGVARVGVRIPAAQANEPFMVTLLNDSGNASMSVDEDGGLTTTGQDRSDATNMVFVSAVDTSVGPMAFAVYHSPIDFPRPDGRDAADAQRTVSVRVQSLDPGANPLDVPVKVVRPPVLLVHGIWSNPAAWNLFSPLIIDTRFFIRRVDYAQTCADGIEVNANHTFDSTQGAISDFKTTVQVAAVQFDAVAHSMGADIIRALIVLDDALRNDNFMRGDVHKLITLGAPHLGTPLANSLYNSSSTCQSTFASNGLRIGDGVRDLQENSLVLNFLATKSVIPIQTHTIVASASQQQTSTVNSNFRIIGRTVCSGLLPSGKIQDVLGSPSDLLVPELSQAAFGLGFDGGSPPRTTFTSVVHTTDRFIYTLGPDELSRVPVGDGHEFAPTGIPGKVTDLLNQPITSPTLLGIRP